MKWVAGLPRQFVILSCVIIPVGGEVVVYYCGNWDLKPFLRLRIGT